MTEAGQVGDDIRKRRVDAVAARNKLAGAGAWLDDDHRPRDER